MGVRTWLRGTRVRAALKEWAINGALLIGSLLFAFAIVEIVLRVFFPIYGGRDNVTPDGRRIQTFLDPGAVYRQYSNEYDALTTITHEGYRAPAVDGNPDVLFVGDSFTFGFGLTDGETFASIYCAQKRLRCANLGMPGSGTLRQVRRLEQFLDKLAWRPKQIKLFFFGMSRSFSSGNDFVDNYNFGRWLDRQPKSDAIPASNVARTVDQPASQPQARQPKHRVGLGEWIISWQETLLYKLHLMRRIKYHWGPMLRTVVLSEPGEERKKEALHYTARAFRELDALSRRMGFEYDVYLIVPVHDIIMGTEGDTLSMLNSVTVKPAVPTADLFRESPKDFYFSYDGHLNVKGAARVAEFLIARDGLQVRR
jgi:hypothetical protein